MKRLFPIALFLLFTSSSLFAIDPKVVTPDHQSILYDRVVAYVNNEVITMSELRDRISFLQKLSSEGSKLNPHSVLNVMINEKITLESADRFGIVVSEKEIDQAIERLASANKLSVQSFLNGLRSRGISLTDYRENLKNYLTNLDLNRANASSLRGLPKIAIQEMEEVLKQRNLLYHILDLHIIFPAKFSGGLSQKRSELSRMKGLLAAQIGNLGTLDLKRFTSHRGVEVVRQDLGWKIADELPNQFLSHLSELKAGNLAGPFLFDNGYHFLLLLEKKSPSVSSRDISINENRLFERLLAKKSVTLLSTLRQNSYIKIIL